MEEIFKIFGLKKIDHVCKAEKREPLEWVMMKRVERELIIGQSPKGNFAWDRSGGQRSRITSRTELVMIKLRIIFIYERDIYVHLLFY